MDAMRELLGVQEATVDGKGRLAIPSKFREALLSFDSRVLYATLKADSHLLLYPESRWRVLAEEELPKMNASPLLRRLGKLMWGNVEKIIPDASWRVLLPPRLRALVHLGQEVVCVGNNDRLEVWARAAWDEQNAEVLALSPEEVEAALAEHDVRI